MQKVLWRAAWVILLCACGGERTSLIDGEWDYSLVGAICLRGVPADGTLIIYEGQNGALSGEYDVCGSSVAEADLGGRIRGQHFELVMFGGTINVVEGVSTMSALTGRVTGLGTGVTFKAMRTGIAHGKSFPPPPADRP